MGKIKRQTGIGQKLRPGDPQAARDSEKLLGGFAKLIKDVADLGVEIKDAMAIRRILGPYVKAIEAFLNTAAVENGTPSTATPLVEAETQLVFPFPSQPRLEHAHSEVSDKLAQEVRDTLKRIRHLIAENRQLSRAQKLAAQELEERYEQRRLELSKSKAYEPISCECKLDRLRFTTNQLDSMALRQLPGFKVQALKRLRCPDSLYSLAEWIHGNGSVQSISVESRPTKGWPAPYRVTIFPKDDSGLLPQDLARILDCADGHKFVLAEIALDFPIDSILDVDFVRRHLLSGKLPMPPGDFLNFDKWGCSKSTRVLRSYPKHEIAAYRIESEFHSEVLRRFGVNRPQDFPKLAALLTETQIFFAQLDELKVVRRLKDEGWNEQEVNEAVRNLKNDDHSIWRQLKYLRNKRLKNARRLVEPHEKVNSVVEVAVKKWALQWAEK